MRSGPGRPLLAVLAVLVTVLLAVGVRAVTAGDDHRTVVSTHAVTTPGAGATPTVTPTTSPAAGPTGSPAGAASDEDAGRRDRREERPPRSDASDGMPQLRALAQEVRHGVKQRAAAQRRQPTAEQSSASPSPAPVPTTATFRVGTLNVLGASHTSARGNKPGYASAAARMPMSLTLIRRAGLDVVGLQEFQAPQLAAFRRATAGSWSVFPGLSRARKAVQNSIAFRTDVWKLEQGLLVDIPYFHGRPFPMPLALLTHRASGHRMWFVNVHNPANTHGDATRHRTRAIAIEAALVERLHRDGTPVVLTGDFNDRADAFCPLVGRTALEASNGGSVSGGCRLPAGAGIDWIFATSDLDVLDHVRDRSALVRRATDHPFVHATLTMSGVPG